MIEVEHVSSAPLLSLMKTVLTLLFCLRLLLPETLDIVTQAELN